jgi:hypothetical protein
MTEDTQIFKNNGVSWKVSVGVCPLSFLMMPEVVAGYA